MSLVKMRFVVLWCMCVCYVGGCTFVGGPGAEGRYSWEAAVVLREADRPHRAAAAALRGELHLQRLIDDPNLLAFKLEGVRLHEYRKRRNNELVPVPSLWDAYGPLEWWAECEEGRVGSVLLEPSLPVFVHNVQRGVSSLVQFQAKEGWFNETDVSGDCLVQYETLAPSVYRKIKSACSLDVGVSVRRVVRVESGAVRAEEELRWGEVGYRGWGALSRVGAAGGGRSVSPTALRYELRLEPDPQWEEPTVKYEEDEDTVEDSGPEEEEVGEDGDERAVRRWERAVAAAERGEGAAGTAAAAAGTGRLWEGALREPEVHAGALRAGLGHVGAAGAAAAVRGPRWLRAGAARVGAGPEGAALEEVGRCVAEGGDPQCAVPWLGALGPGALLDLVFAGQVPLQALQAIRRRALKDHREIKADHIKRLHRIILIPKHPYPIEVLAEALDILFEVGEAKKAALGVAVAPVKTEEIWRALRERGEAELGRYVRGRAGQRGEWWVEAGRSGGAGATVGRAWAGWAGELREEHVLRRGALRTAAVHVVLRGPAGDVFPALCLRAWAQGLESLVGDGDEAEEGTEEVAAGVAWEAEGVPREEVELFRGAGGLAAAAWAASGEPVPVLRRGYWAADGARWAAGAGVAGRAVRSAAGRAAVDGSAAVSLWARGADVAAGLRAAGSARGAAGVRSRWVHVWAGGAVRGAPRLHVSADVHFYGDISLCVKADLAPYTITREWTVRGAGRSFRRREEVLGGVGRTLQLDPALTAHCH